LQIPDKAQAGLTFLDLNGAFRRDFRRTAASQSLTRIRIFPSFLG
jgi:hypothetical protein